MVLRLLNQEPAISPMSRHMTKGRLLSELRFPCRDACESLTIYSTIGAGDTFIAGLLYGLIYRSKGWDFQKRLEFANLIAGLKVTQEGFGNLHRAMDF